MGFTSPPSRSRTRPRQRRRPRPGAHAGHPGPSDDLASPRRGHRPTRDRGHDARSDDPRPGGRASRSRAGARARRGLRASAHRPGPSPPLLDRHPGRPGIGVSRTVWTPTPLRTRSPAEELLLSLIRASELPEPHVNARLGDWEVDFLWAAEQLVVEVDGFASHSSPEAFERDHADAELGDAGYVLLRFTWRQLREEPERTLARIRRALWRRRRSRPRPPEQRSAPWPPRRRSLPPPPLRLSLPPTRDSRPRLRGRGLRCGRGRRRSRRHPSSLRAGGRRRRSSPAARRRTVPPRPHRRHRRRRRREPASRRRAGRRSEERDGVDAPAGVLAERARDRDLAPLGASLRWPGRRATRRSWPAYVSA